MDTLIIKSFTISNSNYEKLLTLASQNKRSRSNMLDMILTEYLADIKPIITEGRSKSFKQAKIEEIKPEKPIEQLAKEMSIKTGNQVKTGITGRKVGFWNDR